jgi:hypothetical protein
MSLPPEPKDGYFSSIICGIGYSLESMPHTKHKAHTGGLCGNMLDIVVIQTTSLLQQW